mmetsp:Transcript_10536/g.19238  ORF Transcript_10536/g.19238 Transcript_10536/m.19238 type:complete len:135 (+) Transcript_10536:64-468(+)
MRAEEIRQEIEASLEDVKFACGSESVVTYFKSQQQWMKDYKVQAIIELDLKIKKNENSFKFFCAACFPFGYATATPSESKGFKVHKDSMSESLSGLLTRQVEGFSDLFQENVAAKLKALAEQEEDQSCGVTSNV